MKTILASAAAAAAFIGQAAAFDHPSFRYCEAGYVNQNVDFETETTAGATLSQLEADSGSGFRAACVFEVLFGLYAHGEYTDADVDFSALAADPADQFNEDGNVASLRLGVGLALDAPIIPVSIYGQASYTQVEFDAGTVIDDTTMAVENFESDDSGFDLEIGARAVLLNRIEGGAFVRYTDVGAVGAVSSLEDIENED
ncbi:MAG: outer membrane beta-barrel protein, partial [Pseudomonadota bacterium]